MHDSQFSSSVRKMFVEVFFALIPSLFNVKSFRTFIGCKSSFSNTKSDNTFYAWIALLVFDTVTFVLMLAGSARSGIYDFTLYICAAQGADLSIVYRTPTLIVKTLVRDGKFTSLYLQISVYNIGVGFAYYAAALGMF